MYDPLYPRGVTPETVTVSPTLNKFVELYVIVATDPVPEADVVLE